MSILSGEKVRLYLARARGLRVKTMEESLGRPNVECPKCHGEGWVCEDHPDLPWEGFIALPDCCSCGAAGMPCRCRPGEFHP